MRSAIKDLWRRRNSRGRWDNQRQDSQASHFCHAPLPEGQYIRLLRIVQSEIEPISVTLQTFPLKQLPAYEALSYTWGKAVCLEGEEDDNDPGTSHEIVVSDKPFIITENLYNGLLELRKGVTGYLWIDALCIDQTNITERASQVLLMGEIYSWAENVIVWLGKEIHEVGDVIWLLEKYLPIAQEDRFPREEANPELLKFLGITQNRWFELWERYGRFYSTYRWFSRAWVVQELLLARKIVMRCGCQTINWDFLKQVTQLCYASGIPVWAESSKFLQLTAIRESLRNGIPSEEGVTFLCTATEAVTAEGRWYTWLMHLVDVIRSQRAGCRHDKVYVVFGLAQNSIPPSLHHVNSLTVNYEQSAEDAFVIFTSDLLRNTPKLALLSQVDPLNPSVRQKCETLPSWCPDFAAGRLGVPLLHLSRNFSDRSQAYKASKSLEDKNRSCYIKGRVLTLTGKKVATITKVGQKGVSALSTRHFKLPGGEGYFDACVSLDPIYSLTGEDRVEVLWRTLLVNCDSTVGSGKFCHQPTADNFSPAFAAFITTSSAMILADLKEKKRKRFLDVIRAREENFKSSNVRLPIISAILELAEAEMNTQGSIASSGITQASNPFSGPAGQYGIGRRLFVTSQKWLGLGPIALKEDDEVWLLKNADVPFILRRRGDSQYTLAGEAYVHGIMHGELIDAPGGSEDFHDIEIV